MKQIRITWFRVSYNYKRENGTKYGDYNRVRLNHTVNTNNANINKLMSEFTKWCKEWQGKGYIEITSISAGAFLEAQEWAEKHNAKYAGKKIKFNN